MTDTPSLAPSTAASDTIDATLRRSASRFPDRVALTFADRRWTYAALDAAAPGTNAALLADRLPEPEADGHSYLKIPLNRFRPLAG